MGINPQKSRTVPHPPLLRRYLALWFPFLPCERVQRTAAQLEGPSDKPEQLPFALVMRAGSALRLAAVDRSASQQGLSAGMTLADAQARCRDLVSQAHDPAADARELDRLTMQMIRLTPMVAADPPDGIILDITGCAHLFGGEESLVRNAIAEAGFTTRHALASHAPAARALARFNMAEDDVLALPIAALELAEDALAGLQRAGLKTLGDLACRPAAGLAARFGAEAVTRLRVILGESSSPLTPRPLTAPIRAHIRFPEPLIRTDDALEAIEDLLIETSSQMEQRQIGGRRFLVILYRSDNARRRLIVETGQPVREPAVVMRLLRERIEALSDPLDPGFGFDAIALGVSRINPLPSRQIALDTGGTEEDSSFAELVDRLSVRLGANQVKRLVPCDRHLPERTQAFLPATEAPTQPWQSGQTDRPPRPLLLFDPPHPVDVIAGVPDGPPQRFRWKGELHEVRFAEGPERLGAEWWRKREGHHSGQAGSTRDYYRVEDSEGRRYWVFRHGLFGEAPDPRWYLHGLFP